MKLRKLINLLPVGDTSVISVYWMGEDAIAHNIFNDDMDNSNFPAFIQTFGEAEVEEFFFTSGSEPDDPNIMNIELKRDRRAL